MRKTKIVCTIGPASETKDIVRGLCKAGMNVARLNFSHNTHADHQRRIDLVKEVREELNLPIAIMLDTKGPEYRIKTFESGKIVLSDGDRFTFTTDEIVGNRERVSVSYSKLPEELFVGDTILLNNGLMSFLVDKINGTDIECKVVCGGELSDRKSMSFPGKVMKQTYLSEQDKKDIAFGVKNGVDYIACSFVSNKQDLIDVHDYLKELGADDIELIAKIENQSGFDNIDEICEQCDGIMIARGDMGVEIAFEQLPAIQKKLITKCRMLGKRVITATEMLESMTTNIRPTRAEISDVANAVYDGSSAVMLSGESAVGKYPIETVQTMASILEETEKHIPFNSLFRHSEFEMKNKADAISHAICTMGTDINAKAIVVTSISGRTVRLVSRFRCPTPIIGMAVNKKVWYKLALSWGVLPVLSEEFTSTDVLFYHALKVAKSSLNLNNGDMIVMTGGNTNGKMSGTNIIKVETI